MIAVDIGVAPALLHHLRTGIGARLRDPVIRLIRLDRDRNALIGADAASRQLRRNFAGGAFDEFRVGRLWAWRDLLSLL